MCDCEMKVPSFEKMSDYKKAMKAFVKGMVKSKLLQDVQGNLRIEIQKDFDKGSNTRKASLIICNEETGVCANFTAEVATRIYNKIDPTLFESLGAQLEKTKNFGKLIVD